MSVGLAARPQVDTAAAFTGATAVDAGTQFLLHEQLRLGVHFLLLDTQLLIQELFLPSQALLEEFFVIGTALETAYLLDFFEVGNREDVGTPATRDLNFSLIETSANIKPQSVRKHFDFGVELCALCTPDKVV